MHAQLINMFPPMFIPTHSQNLTFPLRTQPVLSDMSALAAKVAAIPTHPGSALASQVPQARSTRRKKRGISAGAVTKGLV